METIRESIDVVKSRLVQHIKALTDDLAYMLRADAKTYIDREEYKDAAELLHDIIRHQDESEQLIAMIESTRFIETVIQNIQENSDWFGVYFMEDTLQLMSIMFDTQFEVEH